MSKFLAVLAFALLCLCFGLPGKSEHESYGVVLLDAITFPKIVPLKNLATVVLVSNKNQIGQYATDSMREDYMGLVTRGTFQGNSDEVLFAQILVNGAQNKKLAEKMGIPSGFIHPRLVLYKPGSATPILYPESGAFNDVAITQFISKHTNFYFGIPGLIQAFDNVTKDFMAAHATELESIMEHAKELAAKVEANSAEFAAHYLKVMEKVKESGKEFIATEIKRLEGIMASTSISDKKKRELTPKLNIVKHFDRDL